MAAAVVGGVSVLGGSGTMVGAVLGAVLIDLLDQSLVRVPQVSEFWRDAILGVLILVAVVADALIAPLRRRRRQVRPSAPAVEATPAHRRRRPRSQGRWRRDA